MKKKTIRKHIWKSIKKKTIRIRKHIWKSIKKITVKYNKSLHPRFHLNEKEVAAVILSRALRTIHQDDILNELDNYLLDELDS